ncbi:hypothetical protein CK222_30855, partial [Mesorhizobium sp. WSM3866]
MQWLSCDGRDLCPDQGIIRMVASLSPPDSLAEDNIEQTPASSACQPHFNSVNVQKHRDEEIMRISQKPDRGSANSRTVVSLMSGQSG